MNGSGLPSAAVDAAPIVVAAADTVQVHIDSLRKDSADACDKFEKLVDEQRAKIAELQAKLRGSAERLERQRSLSRRRESELRAIFEEDLQQIDEDYRKAYYDVVVQQREALLSASQRSTLFGLHRRDCQGADPREASAPTLVTKAVQATWTYASRKHASTNTELASAAAATTDRLAVPTQPVCRTCGGGRAANVDPSCGRRLLLAVADGSAWTGDLDERLCRASDAVARCSDRLQFSESATCCRRAKEDSDDSEGDGETAGGGERPAATAALDHRLPPTAGAASDSSPTGPRVPTSLGCETQPSPPRIPAASAQRPPPPPPRSTAGFGSARSPAPPDGHPAGPRQSGASQSGASRIVAAAAGQSEEGSEDDARRLRRPSEGSASTDREPPAAATSEASPVSRWSTATDHFPDINPSASCASVDSLDGGDYMAAPPPPTSPPSSPPSRSSDSLEKFAQNLLASYPRAAPTK